MVNDVSNSATIETSELKNASVHKTSYGETACGIIYLEYENLVVNVQYDTRIGPDGLQTYIVSNVGDEVSAEYYDNWVHLQLTEDMRFLAQMAKAETNVVQNYGDTIVSIPPSKLRE